MPENKRTIAPAIAVAPKSPGFAERGRSANQPRIAADVGTKVAVSTIAQPFAEGVPSARPITIKPNTLAHAKPACRRASVSAQAQIAAKNADVPPSKTANADVALAACRTGKNRMSRSAPAGIRQTPSISAAFSAGPVTRLSGQPKKGTSAQRAAQ